MDEPKPKPLNDQMPSVDLSTPRFGTASEPERLLLFIVRILFLVLLVTVSTLPFVGTMSEDRLLTADFLPLLVGMLTLGIAVVAVDALTPRKRLSTVFGAYLGIGAGLIAAIAVSQVLDVVAASWELDTTRTGAAYLRLAKLAIGMTLCYLAVSIVLTTKDDFRLVIPYVEFAKQVRGVRPLLLDTSALIDGRIEGLAQSGFIDAPLVLPQFVVDELQRLGDSSDKLKRARGRRGLGIVGQLQENPDVDITIDSSDVDGHTVDHQLLVMAGRQRMRILTTDYNLNKVAQIRRVAVLNLNDVASALKSQAIPGQTMDVEVVRAGEAETQGVGFLPDGTMVVIEGGASCIGESVTVVVTNSLQTNAGRMIFAKTHEEAAPRVPPPDAPKGPPPRDRPVSGGPSRSNPRRK